MTIPSREDSYERLQEMAVQFPEENRSVEDQILKKIECEQLHKFLFRTLERRTVVDSGTLF